MYFVKQEVLGELEEKLSNKIGVIKVRTLASKNNDEMIFPKADLPDNIVLDLVYSILIPIK